MIEIREVKSKRAKKAFVDFPTKLYKGNKNYVPPIRMDELNLFNSKKNVSFEDCDVVYYLAYKNNKIVGRIAGIIQKLYNKKTGENRVRFTRFDSINDIKVAKALFNAVEKWAKNKGMEIVHGPLGFNDLDREGLLIEGFDELSTFEEQYNFEYYSKLIEKCGYSKEIDWLEYKLYTPKTLDERINRIADTVLKRYELKIAPPDNKKVFIRKYKNGIFDVIDEAYSPLFGVVPLTEKVRDQLIKQFTLLINMKLIIVVLDKNDKVVAFGFGFPSLSKAMNKNKGKLFPFGFLQVLKATKRPKIIDLALVGLRPEYQGKGINAIIMRFLAQAMINHKIDYCETNLNLEDNVKVQQQWDFFEHKQHKRRRCYIKNLKA